MPSIRTDALVDFLIKYSVAQRDRGSIPVQISLNKVIAFSIVFYCIRNTYTSITGRTIYSPCIPAHYKMKRSQSVFYRNLYCQSVLSLYFIENTIFDGKREQQQHLPWDFLCACRLYKTVSEGYCLSSAPSRWVMGGLVIPLLP